MSEPRTYPHGVPCWVDIEPGDPDAARHFYGELFGWSFTNAMPPGAPGFYDIATLDGADVAAIGPASAAGGEWNTYVAVTSADASAAAVAEAGGTVLSGPEDAGPGGRTAACADPEGARFRLWEARRRPGAQLVNVPGAWNFSDVRAAELAASMSFYEKVFGWTTLPDLPRAIRVAGYGDHLEATVDPGIRTRQAHAPAGFADVIGGFDVLRPGEKPHWHVKFVVASRDGSAARAEQLGATVVSTSEDDWTHAALVRDPQGAEFTISQFAPPPGF